MQRKKNIILMVSLVLLLGFTAVIFIANRSEHHEIKRDLFSSVDLLSVDKVTLQSPKQNISVAYEGTRWRVNGDFNAEDDEVTLLMATIRQSVPRRPIESDSLAEYLIKNGVKVSLWEGDKLAETFYAGGSDNHQRAYFMHEEDKVPYEMVIPGYRVYVSGIFEQPVAYWRVRRIFDFNWQNFVRLSAEFPGDTTANFSVSRKGSLFTVENAEEADTARLNTFLDDVSLLEADNYMDINKEVRDSLEQLQPIMKIQITDIAGRLREMVICPKPDTSGSYVALLSGFPAASLSKRKVDAILRQRSYFLQPPK